ncbi:MAG: glutamate--tRNA ligase [Lentisphaerae bacterium]|nr:glutamate--tRNA ligase [Lentisphaerota bacterium]MCP4103792.1 glutamate--tRNA ligase [Lentisphaerota bacterium]
MEIRVRFAPSPTGQVHIGNIRTAIFNWLFARHFGGKFLLRVEDTDLERSTKEAIDKLLECMEWLGLNYDGKIVYQTSLRQSHEEAAAKLIEEGRAYKGKPGEDGTAPVLFRIPFDCENIPFVRTVGAAEYELHPEEPVRVAYSGVDFATVSRKGKAVPTAACLSGFKDLKIFDPEGVEIFDLNFALEDLKNGETFSFENCAKITFTRREVFYNDLIKGELAKPLDSMKDLVIVRSNGSPVFHLANVCDDIAQNVSHVIRGDDHVENTYRHILLYNALGAELPLFAHMPMIVNNAGKPYSKRDGDAFVGDFREKGFLSKALFNYLALLGWSPGDDREKMSYEEMTEAFTLDRVKSSPARFDMTKLLSLNGMYIAVIPVDEFVILAKEFVCKNDWAQGIDDSKLEKVAALMQSRTKELTNTDSWKYFFSSDFEYGGKQFRKQFKHEQNRAALRLVGDKFASFSQLDSEIISKVIADAEAANEINSGKLFPVLRLAATGAAGGAELDQTLILIGPEECAKRIDNAIDAYLNSEKA